MNESKRHRQVAWLIIALLLFLRIPFTLAVTFFHPEEPLFRGFLWGYLLQLNWKDGWILIVQAALFTSAHLYFAGRYPLMFWVYIPAAAILFGYLTLRSRSIAPAILAHGMINGSVYLLIMMSLRAV